MAGHPAGEIDRAALRARVVKLTVGVTGHHDLGEYKTLIFELVTGQAAVYDCVGRRNIKTTPGSPPGSMSCP